jgi:2-deoxy-D-gluconate 3-dehydrogenase
VANVPMRRWGRADEMAGPAVFLASQASSYMTGQVLLVDGGQTTEV